jgi:hypothetical protein
MDCDTKVVTDEYGRTEVQHKKRRCARCAVERKAIGLSNSVYEWPLSSDPSVAQASIFELRVPEIFSQWRSASIYLIAEVLEFRSPEPRKPRPSATLYGLDTHHDLLQLLVPHYENQRLILNSETKSQTRATKKRINKLKEEQVCLKNSLKYAYYDKSDEVWSTELSLSGELPQKIFHPLSQRSRALTRFLYNRLRCLMA